MKVSVVRANIVVPVASSKIVDYHGVKLGYVQLTSFAVGSGDEVRQQVSRVLKQGARATDSRPA